LPGRAHWTGRVGAAAPADAGALPRRTASPLNRAILPGRAHWTGRVGAAAPADAGSTSTLELLPRAVDATGRWPRRSPPGGGIGAVALRPVDAAGVVNLMAGALSISAIVFAAIE